MTTLRARPAARLSFAACALLAAIALPSRGRAQTPADAAPVAPSAASATIDRLHATLLEVMKNASALGYEGRRAKLAPVIDQVYDLPFMAKVAAGKNWKDLDPGAQQRFVETFSRLTIANYAGRFTGWDGEAFLVESEGDAGQGTRMVRTKLTQTNDKDVQLDYRLRDLGGAWRIIDVYLNGTVSELALRRSEYGALIDREGFAALIQALDAKIAALSSGAEK